MTMNCLFDVDSFMKKSMWEKTAPWRKPFLGNCQGISFNNGTLHSIPEKDEFLNDTNDKDGNAFFGASLG